MKTTKSFTPIYIYYIKDFDFTYKASFIITRGVLFPGNKKHTTCDDNQRPAINATLDTLGVKIIPASNS